MRPLTRPLTQPRTFLVRNDYINTNLKIPQCRKIGIFLFLRGTNFDESRVIKVNIQKDPLFIHWNF